MALALNRQQYSPNEPSAIDPDGCLRPIGNANGPAGLVRGVSDSTSPQTSEVYDEAPADAASTPASAEAGEGKVYHDAVQPRATDCACQACTDLLAECGARMKTMREGAQTPSAEGETGAGGGSAGIIANPTLTARVVAAPRGAA